jgi:hypothetical protein
VVEHEAMVGRAAGDLQAFGVTGMTVVDCQSSGAALAARQRA